ncbi:hypothetical protein HanIR_Chr02g0081571 [Helianthus annuus]|nr:hypothetical protein HanIR_Chr02g0081571 [Helianthus annuus]
MKLSISMFQSLKFLYLLFIVDCSWLESPVSHIFHQTKTEIGSLRDYHLVSEPRWLVSVFGLVGASPEKPRET